jgi:hypothetical protein
MSKSEMKRLLAQAGALTRSFEEERRQEEAIALRAEQSMRACVALVLPAVRNVLPGDPLPPSTYATDPAFLQLPPREQRLRRALYEAAGTLETWTFNLRGKKPVVITSENDVVSGEPPAVESSYVVGRIAETAGLSPASAEKIWSEVCRLARTGQSALPGLTVAAREGGTAVWIADDNPWKMKGIELKKAW